MQRERRYQDERLNNAARELWKYKSMSAQIESLSDKIEEYRERYEVLGSTRFDKICVKGGTIHDKVAEVAIQWADLDIEINRRKVELERELLRISNKLNLLTATQAKVIQLYYIKGYAVSKIASIINYSERQVTRIKTEALEKYSLLK